MPSSTLRSSESSTIDTYADDGKHPTTTLPSSLQKLKPMNQHHPYRIELLDVTPVSVSLLWSTRPPPLSAIPSEIISSPLRQRLKGKTSPNGTVLLPKPSATASAIAPTLVNNPTKATAPNVKHTPTSASQVSTASGSKTSPTLSPPEIPIQKLTDGLVATRSLNRKVTKIRLRAPNSVSSPALATRRPSDSSTTPDLPLQQSEEESCPSDNDGATALEDDAASASSEIGDDADTKPPTMVSVFEDKVNISVNGKDWPHVLMGERGLHEAIVVIFGLEPESDYDVQFVVKGGLDDVQEALKATLRTTSEKVNGAVPNLSHSPTTAIKGQGSCITRPTSPSSLGRIPVSVPDLNSTDQSNQQRKAILQAELDASETLKASLVVELRKAKKEASKAESSLRHEIEAVKRGLDRMSAIDHRNKQKILALQESIKQTTVHVQEIHDEVQAIEDQHTDWEQKEADITQELEQLRQQVDAEECETQSHIESDEAEITALEKEFKTLEAAVKTKETERDDLKQEKLPSLTDEMLKLKEQVKETLNKPTPSRPSALNTFRSGGQRYSSGPSQLIPSQVILPRTKGQYGSGGLGNNPSARNIRFGAHSNGNLRVASGPASHTVPISSASVFSGPMKPFLPPTDRMFRPSQPNRSDLGGSNEQAGSFHPPTTEFGFVSANGINPMANHDALYSLHQLNAFNSLPNNSRHASPFDLPAVENNEAPLPSSPELESGRRSSLPLPHLFGKPTSSALNPANPEFIPAASSAHPSPILSKSALGGGLVNQNIGHGPSITSQTSGVASVEHSPRLTSRFAFPMARQGQQHGTGNSVFAGAGTGTGGSALPSPIGTERTLPTIGAGTMQPSSVPIAPNHQMVAVGATGTGSPFLRNSPLLGTGTSSVSPLLFSTNSPRFLPSHLVDDVASREDGMVTGKFGPLDYDPSMDDFGPAPNLSAGNSIGFGHSGAASSTLPFSSSTIPSLFGSSETWTPPGAPATSPFGSGSSAVGTLAMGPTTWAAPSPPLSGGLSSGGGGGGATTGIWSAPSLAGVSSLRTKLSLGEGELRGRATGNGIPPFSGPSLGFSQRNELGPIGRFTDKGFRGITTTALASTNYFVNLSAPVSPTSPTSPHSSFKSNPLAPLELPKKSTLNEDISNDGDTAVVDSVGPATETSDDLAPSNETEPESATPFIEQ